MRAQVDELSSEAPADRAPEVLLDLAVGGQERRFAVVDRAGDPRGQGVRQCREGDRLLLDRLRVGDADLDRGE